VALRHERVKKGRLSAQNAMVRTRGATLRAESSLPEPGTRQALAPPAASPARSERSA
jgi:hypothetical protein